MPSSSLSGTLAVVSQSGETITFYDTTSWTQTGRIANLPAEPHELEYDSKRKLVYCSHTYRHGHYLTAGAYAHEISVVDPVLRTVVDTIDTRPATAPHGLAIDPRRDILYASVEHLPNSPGGGIIGIDLNTRKVVVTVPSAHRSHWFALTPDGRKAYTCNKSVPSISVLDLHAGRMLGEIPAPGGTEHPAMALDGSRVYFPTPCLTLGQVPSAAAVQVIDTASDTPLAPIPFTTSLQPLHVTARGDLLVGKYAAMPAEISGAHAGFAPARLARVDGRTHEEVGDVELGGLPLTIRSSPDGRLAFVANILPGNVSVVDLEDMRVVATLENDVVPRVDKAHHQGAHGLAFIPAE